MDISPISRLVAFSAVFIATCSSYAITHETVRSRTLSFDSFAHIGASIRKTECPTSRTAFAVSAALTRLRYNHNLKDRDLRSLQFWTDRPWPTIPPIDYEVNGVNINDMKVQSFHFSVKAPSVDAELSMFLLAFLEDGHFKFALYFNENMGVVGYSFQEVVGNNLLLRHIPEWPYLNEQEVSVQRAFLDRLWQDADASSTSTPRRPPGNNVIQTNEVEVFVDDL